MIGSEANKKNKRRLIFHRSDSSSGESFIQKESQGEESKKTSSFSFRPSALKVASLKITDVRFIISLEKVYLQPVK